MQNILIYLLTGAIMLFGGCAIHTPDVQQGNVLEPDVLAQLHTGLTKKQVRFLMGTPIIQDPFHPQRWDYVYWLKAHNKPPVQHRVTVFFDNDVVSRLETEGIALPAPAAAPAAPKAPETDPASQ
jgi:outer membrane protein assembly factor BamE